ncbi:MAG: hypothetical protein GX216_02355 [Methanomicrobiales archaeon]|nr:hypothetical protein [Methanomicrobiales archaeon]
MALTGSSSYGSGSSCERVQAGASAWRSGYARVTGSQEMSRIEAEEVARTYAGPGEVAIFGVNTETPPGIIQALRHYRLIYESSPDPGASVKVFEHVKGAEIPGEGVIEVPVTTNTGREFVYRQASENGRFIVPYSTHGNPYDVKATENYRIAGDTGEFTVTEDAVMGGV